MNRRITILQTVALPLGYAAKKMERETGFEPATSTLARLHSTAELFPPRSTNYLTFSARDVNLFFQFCRLWHVQKPLKTEPVVQS